MKNLLKDTMKKWWIVLVLGVLSLAFGCYCVANPALAAEAFSGLIIAYFIASGIVEAAAILYFRNLIPAWGWNFAGALLSVILGILVATTPGSKELLMLMLFASAFFMEAANKISLSFMMKRTGIAHWLLVLLSGILTAVMAGILVAEPAVTFLSIGVLLGCSFIFNGVGGIIASIAMSKANAVLKMPGNVRTGE